MTGLREYIIIHRFGLLLLSCSGLTAASSFVLTLCIALAVARWFTK